MALRDPLANPAPLIRRVYAYVAYRIGDCAEAEDVTSEVFERALKYRSSYDPALGDPISWLLGIARRCVDDSGRRSTSMASIEEWQGVSPENVESDAIERLALEEVIARLDDRSRDLLALRYGSDLSARQIGEVIGLKTNAVEVALHRTLALLRTQLTQEGELERRQLGDPAAGTSH